MKRRHYIVAAALFVLPGGVVLTAIYLARCARLRGAVRTSTEN
jgi:hypothetical protein